MKKSLLAIIVVIYGLYSCTEQKKNETEVSTTSEEIVNSEEVIQNSNEESFLGEAFNTEDLTSLNNLVNHMNESDSLNATVEITVTEVCQAKGCWMTAKLPNGESMRITFKDYGFFMPKDLAGKTVRMHGVAKREETDVATLKHFAEDAGKSEEEIAQITEAKLDYKFVASGVNLMQ
ncbi:DUF4920 domain-containing protein [Marivirga arenosa]|uniref:DUF4920 domain-containing protein n=1 Tax=Marivirga arenosa TaxID=3059076 RepID=A0AA49GF07_9BACT|nr:DUF4920 domain-containing protein [Marivirga sp. BKB1-2]WKK81523.1 DUF4920 domain-containing protein [Marivirga sp. BKB1-2]